MPTSTNCLCMLGFVGLMASAGCTSTTATNQSASLAPVAAATPAPAPGTLPDTMDIASVDRNTAAGDVAQQGTLITAVAYASPAPESGGVAAINTAVAQADATQTASPQQAVASAATAPDAAPTQQAAAFVAEKLREFGCDEFQGYFFGKPQTLDEGLRLASLPQQPQTRLIAAR